MQGGEVILFSTKSKRLLFYLFSYRSCASGLLVAAALQLRYAQSQTVFLVIIYSVLSNPQVTNAQLIFYLFNIINEDPSMLVGTSETVRMFSTCLCSKNEHNKGNDDTDLKGRQWIAGVIVATRR